MAAHVQDQLLNCIDLLLDAVFLVDADGRVKYVNAACERIFGYTQAEIAPVIRKTAKYKTTEAIIKESLKALSHM